MNSKQTNEQTDRQTKQAKKLILCRGIADFKGLTVILFIEVLNGNFCSPENSGEITPFFILFMNFLMVLVL